MASTAQLTGQVLFFDLSAPDEPAFSWSVGVNTGPWHPVFSPDGQRIAALAKDDETFRVVVDGSPWSDRWDMAWKPVFSPDETSLYFLSERSGSFNVWKLDLDNPRNPVQVTSHDTHHQHF